MKTISPGLKAAIEAGNICTLYTIKTADGLKAYYYTDHDAPLTVAGDLFQPSPGVQRFSMKLDNTASVSNQNVAATVLDLPEDELSSGIWDSASLEVAIASWQNPANGKVVVFKGSLGIIQWTDQAFIADIHNFVRDLAKNIGQVVMPTCRHVLYDLNNTGPNRIGSCGVNPSGFTSTSAVNAILTQGLKIRINSTGRPTGWATTGFLTWTAGANAGTTIEVKTHTVDGTGESVEFLRPTFNPIAPGDTFNLLAGCDRTLATCRTKFNNVVNFGGFPHLQVDVNANINIA